MGNNCCYSTRRKLFEDLLLDERIGKTPKPHVKRIRTKASEIRHKRADAREAKESNHQREPCKHSGRKRRQKKSVKYKS